MGEAPCAVEWTTLPTVQPGQLWLIELPATDPNYTPLECRALTTANVVIYDRALASIVAEILPIGGYAEPASSIGGAEPYPALERCLQFARDGWSVVRLVEHRVSSEQRAVRIRYLSERLMVAKASPDLPVFLFAAAGSGACAKTEVHLGALSGVVTGHSVENRLSIVFSAISSPAAPCLFVASTNGLAG
jgi:hypothetical protein